MIRCAQDRVKIQVGDCRDLLRAMPAGSVDACVCDPPYHLTSIVKRFGAEGAAPARSNGASGVYARASAGFMGQVWDSDVAFKSETWAEVWRVLRPGAWLIAFGGTRTYHRLACAIEDAGFDIRDQLVWIYGSGFPKSLDVAKAIDKEAGTVGSVEAKGAPVKRLIPGADQNTTGSWIKDSGRTYQPGDYVPGSPEAEAWQGWGTALKPANEPAVLARKPLPGTVAANVLSHGAGALNVDGCRVPLGESDDDLEGGLTGRTGGSLDSAERDGSGWGVKAVDRRSGLGRWPANVAHDGSPEVIDALGPAARFFYCAKASRAERGSGNTHPTVKPAALMAHLIQLVTRPGGLILDPFAGSGTTGLAAARHGFRAILMEQSAEYAEIARARISTEWREARPSTDAPAPPAGLFDWAAE